MTLLLLLACADKDDTAPADTDADTDTDTDTDTDADTDGDSDTDCTGSVSGTVVGYDGALPVDLDVQFCEVICYTTTTGAGGEFSFEGMCPASYKLDGVGEYYPDWDYGHVRTHVELGAGEARVVDEPLYLPRMLGPLTVSDGTPFTWGNVTVGLDISELTFPIGAEEGPIWVGSVEADQMPALWPEPATYGIAFLPFQTEVAAPFTLSATGELAPGDYDIWSIDDHGVLEEAGIVTVEADGDIPNATVTPSFLTWLLFVPR